ncbi:hypothetical protein WQ54_03100 [Bacillus sp. SA1-12]|uniref:DUF2268 domain-containing protein n=1 Tax=Bacillus sp. SA1-12 TaxID=1455638 RepID=UPI0006255845|nr:DUF2268 domain-containing putative Zn-dependent protease [Bacillus sp. SA1-12]KKI93613.1 hypothetical protein WQ54_03100 [Bacillus sp. SA1-12]
MSIIDTKKWLKETYDQRDICKKLTSYFPQLKEGEIAKYLSSFGMYKRTGILDDWLEKMEKENIYEFVKEEEEKLRKEWNGPNIPIFIFPSDIHNRKIESDYKGRSGLAFHNKLFLFLSLNIIKSDIKSVLIHEYHHVCRINSVSKKEQDFTIIDTIILEGLAENAVREKLGDCHVAAWTTLYTDAQCERFFERIIYPQKELSVDSRNYPQLMYGTGLYPNMLGYAVGYYIVKNYMNQTGEKTINLLSKPAEEIINRKK